MHIPASLHLNSAPRGALCLYAALLALLAWWALVVLAPGATPSIVAGLFTPDWRAVVAAADLHAVARFAALTTLGVGGLLIGCTASLAAANASPARAEPYWRSLAVAAAMGALFGIAWAGVEHGRASAAAGPALGLAFAAELFVLRRAAESDAAHRWWVDPAWVFSWGLSGALAAVIDPAIVIAMGYGLTLGVLGGIAGQQIGQAIEAATPRAGTPSATRAMAVMCAIAALALFIPVPWGPEAIAMLVGLTGGAADVAWLTYARRKSRHDRREEAAAIAGVLALSRAGAAGTRVAAGKNCREK
jgi:hypothetical protein